MQIDASTNSIYILTRFPGELRIYQTLQNVALKYDSTCLIFFLTLRKIFTNLKKSNRFFREQKVLRADVFFKSRKCNYFRTPSEKYYNLGDNLISFKIPTKISWSLLYFIIILSTMSIIMLMFIYLVKVAFIAPHQSTQIPPTFIFKSVLLGFISPHSSYFPLNPFFDNISWLP